MKTFNGGLTAALACVLLTFPALSFATTIFSDDFDSDSATTELNFDEFLNWDVSDGDVDYVRNGAYGLACHGNSGACVDMDGTSNAAGVLTSKAAFSFIAGTEYTLSFWISGNQRPGGSEDLEYGIAGTSFTGELTGLLSEAPWTLYTLTFTPTAAFSGNIFFWNSNGGDQEGPLLDDVLLAFDDEQPPVGTPEPGSLGLLALGLLGLGLIASRKRHQTG